MSQEKRYLIEEVYPDHVDWDDALTVEELVNMANQMADVPEEGFK